MYNGNKFSKSVQSKFYIGDDEPGQSDLVLKSTDVSDAGLYICEESVSLDNAAAMLIVLGN